MSPGPQQPQARPEQNMTQEPSERLEKASPEKCGPRHSLCGARAWEDPCPTQGGGQGQPQEAALPQRLRALR